MHNINFDDLKFGKKVGKGGFGEVYVALCLNRVVAVKVLDPSYGNNNEATDDKEAILLSSLKHKNIVSLFGFCDQNVRTYIVMEYAYGGSLQEARAKGSFSAAVLRECAYQIAQGMHYLHHHHEPAIIHRDLKSPNVLVVNPIKTPDDLLLNTLKIADFGLASNFVTTAYLNQAGTVPYMAPEVLSRGKFSLKSDVWSYGILMWELLTGTVPYAEMNVAQIIYAVTVKGRTPRKPSYCPYRLRELLRSCWYIEYGRRMSFDDLLENLKRDEWEDVRISPRRSLQAPQKGRNKIPPAVVAVAMVVTVGVIIAVPISSPAVKSVMCYAVGLCGLFYSMF